MTFFLGLQVHQSDSSIFVSQTKYAKEVLEKFSVDRCNPTSTPLAVNVKLTKDDKPD
uniref:Reverse transcriptase Ty1/copia-type domain-containing protein n=1 Tax=Rhizophora mucronata TaxID=61149 RepID=A0A2P2P183_RHIMU